MTDCWNHILTNLSASVGAMDFKVWFAPVSGEISGRTLSLSVQGSEYMARRLQKKFGSLIQGAAAEQMNCRPDEVVLKVASSGVSSQGRKQPGAKGEQSLNLLPEGSMPVQKEPQQKPVQQRAARQKKPAQPVAAQAQAVQGQLPGAENAAGAQSRGRRQAAAGAAAVTPSVPVGFMTQTVSDEGGSRRAQPRMVEPTLIKTMPLTQGLTLSGDNLIRKQWRYTFDDFVTGPSNAMAMTAAMDMCRPQSFVETLFMSSDPGLGKTHIVQSAVRQILEDRGSNARVAYLTGDEFYARFRMGLVNDTLDDFMGRVRALDFLLVDDIQALGGKTKTQEVLLSLVKHLKDRGSRVVFSSRFTPKELKKLDSQLVSLVSSGVQTSMDDPDYSMRCEILRRKAAAQNVVLPEEVVAALADGIEGDVRQLESCLQTLILKGRVLETGITPELAMEVLGQFATPKKDSRKFTIDGLINCVSREYSITEQQLCSCLRRRHYVEARNVLFYLARKYTTMTLMEIGARVNKRHSTVIKGIATIEHNLTVDTATGRQTAAVVRIIEQNAGCIEKAK